jgi:hypothetical protein
MVFGNIAGARLVGAGAGLVVGLAVHAGTAFVGVKGRQRGSHYRYLSIMEHAGVVFRSDIAGFN